VLNGPFCWEEYEELKPKSKHTKNDAEPKIAPKYGAKKPVGGNPPDFFHRFCLLKTPVRFF